MGQVRFLEKFKHSFIYVKVPGVQPKVLQCSSCMVAAWLTFGSHATEKPVA